MDRAYEGDDTRALAAELGCIPVVPPKTYRKNPWDYDKQLYKRFRRIFTPMISLMFSFFPYIYFALIVDALM